MSRVSPYEGTVYETPETVVFPVPQMKMDVFACVCLVPLQAGEWRQCRKGAEFWMATPWGSEVMVCFTHANANAVRLPT